MAILYTTIVDPETIRRLFAGETVQLEQNFKTFKGGFFKDTMGPPQRPIITSPYLTNWRTNEFFKVDEEDLFK